MALIFFYPRNIKYTILLLHLNNQKGTDMNCKLCGKEITSKPCPYCGSRNVIMYPKVEDHLKFTDNIAAVVIGASAQATIEMEGQIKTFKFEPGSMSGEIADASLHDIEINGIDRPVIREQVIHKINELEAFAQNQPTKQITHEHSFQINFGFLKYRYKRTSQT